MGGNAILAANVEECIFRGDRLGRVHFQRITSEVSLVKFLSNEHFLTRVPRQTCRTVDMTDEKWLILPICVNVIERQKEYIFRYDNIDKTQCCQSLPKT